MGFTRVRKCRGDGNCYYRAVYYSYFENMIGKGPKFLSSFIQMLKDRQCSPVLKEIKDESMFFILEQVLEQILLKLQTSNIKNKGKEAYQHLFQAVHLIPDFDLAAVKFLRELLYQFLKENRFKTLMGLKLEEAIIGDASSIEEYNESIVRKMGEEARSLLLPLLPLILRIKVGTVLLDPKDQSAEVYIEPFKASVDNYESPFPRELDCSSDEITLLLKPGHYDILYKEDRKKIKKKSY